MSNNKQSSSIDWYAKQIDILHYDYFTEHISKDEKNERLKQLKQQAKAMHKEEILSFESLLDEHEINALNNNTMLLTREEFYNETFGGNNE